MSTAADTVGRLVAGLGRRGIAVTPDVSDLAAATAPAPCPVLRWAASGAMSLTGWRGEAPQWPTGDVIGRLDGAARLLGVVARGLGTDLALDIGALLTQRAAARGAAPSGAVSVGGRCRLVRASDGWVAVNLARPTDLELLPALTGGAVPPCSDADPPGEVWDGLKEFVSRRPGDEVVAGAQLLGLPAARLPASAPGPGLPWAIQQLGQRAPTPTRPPVVVDFSAMWAGPLCAHLLGRCGAHVIKVEDVGRPDGARRGDPWLFTELHRHHDQVLLDFRSPADRRALRRIVDRADMVVESSRPRALATLGFSPQEFLGARAGRTWVSITGYGRDGPRSNWVAFGDDAAVAGRLVGTSGGSSPVFCADAIADPVSGLCAATGAAASFAGGGGHLVDCSMQASSAFANQDGNCAGEHRVERHGSTWSAYHDGASQRVESAADPRGRYPDERLIPA
jgi:hypothetical protein